MDKQAQLFESVNTVLKNSNLTEKFRPSLNDLESLAENLKSGARFIDPGKLKNDKTVAEFRKKLDDLNIWMNKNLVDTGIIV